MEFTKIRLVGKNNVDMPLEGVGPITPYVLKAADGLGPPEVDVSILPMLSGDGYYQGRRPQLRQIILRVGLQPEWNIGQTPEDLRSALYQLLTLRYPNEFMYLQVMNGDIVVAQTDGHISRMEVAAFSKDPEVQITMNCTEPYLKAPNPQLVNPAGVVSGSNTIFSFDNPGTAPTPFEIRVRFKAAAAGPVRLTYQTSASFYIEVNRPFAIDDQLVISTIPDFRSIYKKPVATGALNNVLDSLNPSSNWLQLVGGDNQLRINHPNVELADGGIKLYPRYWGI